MSHLTETRPLFAALADRYEAFMATRRAAAAKREACRRTRDELLAQSDRALADMGFAREDVPRIARESVYGR